MLGLCWNKWLNEDEWTLVKINTEEESDLARQFRDPVHSTCQALRPGQAVADFSGALSWGAIRELQLETHLPDRREA